MPKRLELGILTFQIILPQLVNYYYKTIETLHLWFKNCSDVKCGLGKGLRLPQGWS